MVFYRKYRPQRVDELDSTAVREKLSAVLQANISHAFLFTGSKGLGKTSAARIIAKVVNCEKRKKQQIEPCNKCEMCMSITNGTNMDILEIDAASNRGIDEIRSLRDTIKLAPFAAKRKVYIIDEVHMLTTEAFNALLKTLEEPPSHAIFILCTTEPHKVPETIVSRCLHISFQKASDDELVRSFQRVVKGENIAIDNEALLTIAKLSDGAFRDGVKTLEEIVLLAQGKKVTNELIEEKYKVITISLLITDMLEHLIRRDAKNALMVVTKIVNDGIDIKYFTEQLISSLHEIMLAEIGVKNHELKIPKGLGIEIGEIKNLVDILSKAHQDIKFAVLPQLPLELAIVEWAIVKRSENVSSFPTGSAIKDPRIREDNKKKKDSSPAKLVQNDNSGFWQKFIDTTKSYNHSLAGVLRSCRLKEHAKNGLVIQTPYEFHKQKLEERKAVELLEKVYEEVAGKKGSIVVELKNKDK